MLDPENVAEGDVLLGLASSGLHSNGYSLARKVCLEGRTHYEVRLPQSLLGGESVQDALLEPTRIYVKSVHTALTNHPHAVHALAHITGGGITENLNRALPSHLDAQVDIGSWTMKPIIPFVCRAAKLSESEALKTFNMGLGLVLIVDAAAVDSVEHTLQEAGEEVFRVGHVVAGSGAVRYTNEGALLHDVLVEEEEENQPVTPIEQRTQERDVFYEEEESD